MRRSSKYTTRSRARWGCAVIALLASCSAQLGHHRACESLEQCRAEFGFGAVCGDDGFCRVIPPHPRCTASDPPDLLAHPERHGDDFVVGTIYAPIEPAQVMLRAAELAFRQANRQGGLDARPLALLHCDPETPTGDGLDAIAASADAARYLADVGIPAILGPTTSGRALGAFDAVEGRDVLFVSPAATSPQLITADETAPSDERPGLLWRTVPSDDLQGRVLAADMRGRGVRRLAILHEPGAYGDGLAVLVEAELEGFAEVESVQYEVGALGTEVLNLAAHDVDAVLFVSSVLVPDTIGFLDAASATPALLATYSGRTIYLADAASHAELITGVMPDARSLFPRIRGTRPAARHDSRPYMELSTNFVVEFGEDPSIASFTPHSYDAAWLLLYAAAWARAEGEEPLTGTALARGLRHMSSGTSVTVGAAGWPEALAALARAESLDIEGASGPLDFDPRTEELLAPIEVWTLAEHDEEWALTTEYVVQPSPD